jgi:hypothetical protein
MKTKLSLLLCLGILLAACKKTAVTPANTPKGTWELRATRYGNILPRTYPQDNGNVLSFGNTAFAQYFADVLVDSGSYAKSANLIYQYTIFVNDSNGSFTNNVIIKGDTLELIPINPDAARGFYVRTGYNPLH